MAKYYSIKEERIIIKPLAFLLPIGIAFCVLFLLMPVTMILIMVKGQFQEIETKNFLSSIILVPFLFGCIPFFTYSRRQVIFETSEKTIYLKTIFGKRVLMTFDEVADIISKITLGIAYYLKSKADRYGKGYRISPSFANANDKSKQEYEDVVLKAIRELITTQQAQQISMVNNPVKPLLEDGMLTFYKPYGDGYLLKPKGTLKFLPGFIAFGIFACIAWYPLISGTGWSEDDKVIPFVPLVPLIITLAMLTKRIVFDLVEYRVRLYVFGLPFFTYPLSDFSGFNIVRKTHNGIYSGTDVRMKFVKEGNKGEKELTLGDFGKTNPIEPFINETEFILKKFR